MSEEKKLMEIGEKIDLGSGYVFELTKIETYPKTSRPMYGGFILKDGKYLRDTLLSDIIIMEAKGIKEWY